MKRLLLILGSLIFAMTLSTANAEGVELDPENTLYMDLAGGRVVIKLYPEIAPTHVSRIKELTRDGFYDGLTWHRVIPDFMAQTGDPTGTGTGGTGMYMQAEFSDLNFGRGTIGAARLPNDIHTGDSQFFICFTDCSFLNGDYTIWGQVVEGMEYVDELEVGEPPMNPSKIIKMRVMADALYE